MGIGGGIELAIRFMNGMIGIRGEVIPEMLEIDPLPAFDEGERRLTVKMKMPEIPEKPDGFPVTNPRKKCIHQRDTGHLAGKLCGMGIRNHQSDIVPGDRNS